MILPLLLLFAQAVSPELAQHVNAGLAAVRITAVSS